MPRGKDAVWCHFGCIKKEGNSGKWAKCLGCGKEMQGIPDRLKSHIEVCSKIAEKVDDEVQMLVLPSVEAQQLQEETSAAKQAQEQVTSMTIATTASSPPPVKKKKSSADQTPTEKKGQQRQRKLNFSKDGDIVSTSQQYKNELDEQVGRYYFATNTPFHHASHPEFIKLCEMLRPGYTPPNEHQVGGWILNSVHDKAMTECREITNGQTVSMSLDGWSNVHTEPIVCCSIVNENGQSILTQTIDTSGNAHTADYLADLAANSVKDCEARFNVRVGSFVTDNAANVQKMRRELVEREDMDIIQYGCSAHILNLLAKDVTVSGVTKRVTKVLKYFRNKHLPHAWYQQAGGKMLVLPIEVRWNTFSDSIRSFLENRGVLVQVCQDHAAEIDETIAKYVNDVSLIADCQAYLSSLCPIAVALDRAQSDSATIAVCVEIWNKLKIDLNLDTQPKNISTRFFTRMDMALTPAHFLANILDHRFCGKHLTSTQKASAFEYLNTINPEFVPIAMGMLVGDAPFPKYLFGDHFMSTPPMIWWRSVHINQITNWELLKPILLQLCEKLLTAVASTAGLERIFSTFGIVQSKLRNRLGNEKAGKLTFMFKHFNQAKSKQPQSGCKLNWMFDPAGGKKNPSTSQSQQDETAQAEATTVGDVEAMTATASGSGLSYMRKISSQGEESSSSSSSDSDSDWL